MKEGYRPVFFDFNKPTHQRQLNQLRSRGKVCTMVDTYKDQLRELFSVQHPAIADPRVYKREFQEYFNGVLAKLPIERQGQWIYFPWRGAVVHVLNREEFYSVRTARNKNLITQEEQRKFYNSVVGIVGLSVGSGIALALAIEGGARRMRLADQDTLALSNLNRIPSTVASLGLNKAYMIARQIYEVNPYCDIQIFGNGLTKKNIKAFFDGPPKIDIVIDEIDDISMKYLIRREARKRKLPVVMAADNGDDAVIDIERYDINPRTTFFHGRMGAVTYKRLQNLTKAEIGSLIAKHIGIKNVPLRMQESFLKIGKTLISWPQLGGTVFLNGAAVVYCVRKVLLGGKYFSGRVIISLEKQLYSVIKKERQRSVMAAFRKAVNSNARL